MALVAGFVAFALLDPPLGIFVLAAGAVIEVGEAYFWTRYLKRIRVRTGVEGLIGERGEAIETCDPRGQVRVRGEIWTAICEPSVGAGDGVRVVSIDGLTLGVEPAPRR